MSVLAPEPSEIAGDTLWTIDQRRVSWVLAFYAQSDSAVTSRREQLGMEDID